ncbi:MAG: baseplate J/gp47 family protein [Desulfobacterales bacterium]|nr:baseplate J/gp47 family protein [Desulfobacterales bacterium]
MSIPVSKTLDEVRQDLFDRIASVQSQGHLPQQLNLNKGVVRGLIELWAWGLYQLYQFVILVFHQLFPVMATDKWLDLHCSQVGVQRQTQTKALGRVNFTREETAGNVTIRKNSIVKTKPDGAGMVHRFVVLDSVVLQDGQESISVNVESEDYGQQANVTPGMISEMSTVIPGVDAVENPADWLTREAVDNEKNDRLKERYELAWKDINGSTKYAYESWARSVSGVVSAKILDRHPRGQGTVDVVIKGTAGLPTVELIDEVVAVVEENRPVNDDARVLSPEPVNITITAELVLFSGTPDVILATVENRIHAIFTDPSVLPDVAPIKIGEDLTLDRLRHVIMAVGGIKKINWTSPSGDTPVPDTGLAVLEGINLNYVWADED